MTVKIKRGKDAMVIEVDYVHMIDMSGSSVPFLTGTLVYESPETILWYDGETASIIERRNVSRIDFPIKDFNV